MRAVLGFVLIGLGLIGMYMVLSGKLSNAKDTSPVTDPSVINAVNNILQPSGAPPKPDPATIGPNNGKPFSSTGSGGQSWQGWLGQYDRYAATRMFA